MGTWPSALLYLQKVQGYWPRRFRVFLGLLYADQRRGCMAGTRGFLLGCAVGRGDPLKRLLARARGYQFCAFHYLYFTSGVVAAAAICVASC